MPRFPRQQIDALPAADARTPERDTIATTRGDLRMLLSDHIDAALLRGACVMYCLLTDGAR